MKQLTIAICTRNRADSLAATLASIAHTLLPVDIGCELIIVDNGSTDNTRDVVESINISGIKVRYVFESKPGLSNARNRALQESTGDVLLFTDDDVRAEGKWISGMVAPIISGNADVVCGNVKIAEHLHRPWMTETHKAMFAATYYKGSQEHPTLVGANMAFAKTVLEKVPQFDPELGAGAIGFGEETLFSDQLHQASFRFAIAEKGFIIHHFDENRLRRSAIIDTAFRMGLTQAYLLRHWHQGFTRGYWLRGAFWMPYAIWMRCQGHESLTEGCSLRTFYSVVYGARFLGYIKQLSRPPNYTIKGLQKKHQEKSQ